MAEKPSEIKAEKENDDAKPDESKSDDGNFISLDDLRGIVKNIVADITGSGKSDKKTDSGDSKPESSADDIASRVKSTIEDMHKQERARARDNDLDEIIKAHKEKPKEKQPIERRKVHKFMGWGEP